MKWKWSIMRELHYDFTIYICFIMTMQNLCTEFDLITAHTPISEQSSCYMVFRLQSVYFFIHFFIKAYVVGTYLNCLNKLRQFKLVATTYAFIKIRKKYHINRDYYMAIFISYPISTLDLYQPSWPKGLIWVEGWYGVWYGYESCHL